MTSLPGAGKPKLLEKAQPAATTDPIFGLPPESTKSPELLEKLNDALDDINKRIARQSVLWVVLKSSKY